MATDTMSAAVVRVMDAVDRVLVILAQAVLAGLMILTFVNVIGRSVFHESVPDSLIFSEMMMVALVFLPMGYVQSVGEHLEVTVLSDLFSLRVQRLLFAIGLLLGFLVFGLMAWLGWLSAYDAFQSGVDKFGSVLYIPEWPARMMIPLGLGWWCLRMLVQFLLPRTRPEGGNVELRQALNESELDDDPASRR